MEVGFKKTIKIIFKILIGIIGIWFGLLAVIELALSQSVLNKLIDKYSVEYIDGDLDFGNVSISMFRRFPSLTLTLEDFSITYPADRFDKIENSGAQGHLTHKGCGQECDTLASFKKFSAAVNIYSLATGTIQIPYLQLDKPRIFAHSYYDGSTNWDIFKFEESEQNDSDEIAIDSTEQSAGIPKLDIGRVWMSGKPLVVYTDSRDTIFASISMRNFEIRGDLGLTLDSMFVAGRLGRDTLALGLDKLYLHRENSAVNVDAAAKAFMATNGYGRMMVPINMNGIVSFPEEGISDISTKDFKIEIASIPIVTDADIHISDEGLCANGDVRITKCNLKSLIDRYGTRFVPELDKYSTDIFLGMNMNFDLTSRERMLVNCRLKDLSASAAGLEFKIAGSINDLLGSDPEISMDGKMSADLEPLASFLPDSLDAEAYGIIKGHIEGKARLSQLSMYNFSKASLSGSISADRIDVNIPNDSIKAVIDSFRIVLGPEDITMRSNSKKKIHLLGVTGSMAKADISLKKLLHFQTEDFLISAKNSVDTDIMLDSISIHPFSGKVAAKMLSLKDMNGTALRLNNSSNSFRITPQRKQRKAPLLTLSSRNEKIFLKSEYNRVILSNANMKASAAMNTIERRQKVKGLIDSLARVYPDTPKDSLIYRMMASRKRQNVSMPSWLQEEDFNKQDIDISLDKSLAKYFREWDLNGNLSVEKGMLMTPYFPLRNHLNGFDLKFTNNEVNINQFEIKSGESDISAAGSLTGLRRALMGHKGAMKLNVDITSDCIDANQLLKAYNAGSRFSPEKISGSSDHLSDEQFMEQIISDTTDASTTTSLIVVPANLIAEIKVNATNATYSDLMIDTLAAHLTMKERCVQIHDTKVQSNMGGISMEGFYSTRSKKDIKTGFSLNLTDITAEKAINLMPAIDTIMPLLKSFGGLLNCEIAATASLDTNMNIIMPSIDGVMRISGKNLTITDNEMFNKLATVLMFRNKKKGQIDMMTVEGVIHDNKLEVFPFILEMDRYMLGLSGIQNMDMSFRYHASLIKSPLLVKLGMDIYGSDFDHMKFKLGKAKYKSKNIPVFTTVIDDTKINLVKSIRSIYDKGVDAVISESQKMTAIEEHKKSLQYVAAVDQELEELSPQEQAEVEAEQNTENESVNE